MSFKTHTNVQKPKYRSRLAQLQPKNHLTSTITSNSSISSSKSTLALQPRKSLLHQNNNLNHAPFMKRSGTVPAAVTPIKQREDMVSITFGCGDHEKKKSKSHVLSGNLCCLAVSCKSKGNSIDSSNVTTTTMTTATDFPKKLPKQFVLKQMIPIRQEKEKLYVTNLDNGTKEDAIDMSLQHYILKQNHPRKALTSSMSNNRRNKRMKPSSSSNKENEGKELDLRTINVMLYTMNAGLLLSASSTANDENQYLLRPKSNKSAILQPFEILKVSSSSEAAQAFTTGGCEHEKGTTLPKESTKNSIVHDKRITTTISQYHEKQNINAHNNIAANGTNNTNESTQSSWLTTMTTKESAQDWSTQLTQDEWSMNSTHPLSLEHAVEMYGSCLETNKPTPLEWVSKQLPRSIMVLDTAKEEEKHTRHNSDPDNKNLVIDAERLSQLFLWKDDKNVMISPTIISERVRRLMNNRDGNDTNSQENNQDELTGSRSTTKEILLRLIQLQVMVRLQLYAMAGSIFLDSYMEKFHNNESDNNTKKKKSKKKRKRTTSSSSSSPLQQFIQDIADILSTATFLLGFNIPLSSFLQESPVFPGYMYHSIPMVLQEIYDFFEISNPHTNQDEDTDNIVKEDTLGDNEDSGEVIANNPNGGKVISSSPTKQENKNNKTSTSSVAHLSTSSPDKMIPFSSAFSPSSSPFKGKTEGHVNPIKKKVAIHKKSFQMTTNTISKNALLKGSQQKYVGSHFNTNAISRLAVKVPAATAAASVGAADAPAKQKSKVSAQAEKTMDLKSESTATAKTTSVDIVGTSNVNYQHSHRSIATAKNDNTSTSTRHHTLQEPQTKKLHTSLYSETVDNRLLCETPSTPSALATTITKASYDDVASSHTPTKALWFSEDQTPIKKKPKKMMTSLVGHVLPPPPPPSQQQQTPVRKQQTGGSGVSFFDSPLPSSQPQNARLVVQAALAARRKGKSLSFPRPKKKK